MRWVAFALMVLSGCLAEGPNLETRRSAIGEQIVPTGFMFADPINETYRIPFAHEDDNFETCEAPTSACIEVPFTVRVYGDDTRYVQTLMGSALLLWADDNDTYALDVTGPEDANLRRQVVLDYPGYLHVYLQADVLGNYTLRIRPLDVVDGEVRLMANFGGDPEHMVRLDGS